MIYLPGSRQYDISKHKTRESLDISNISGKVYGVETNGIRGDWATGESKDEVQNQGSARFDRHSGDRS
jgi:hypothetical protein